MVPAPTTTPAAAAAVTRAVRKRIVAGGSSSSRLVRQKNDSSIKELADEIRIISNSGGDHRIPLMRIQTVLEAILPNMTDLHLPGGSSNDDDMQLILQHYHHKLFLSTDSPSDYLSALALLSSSSRPLGKGFVDDMIQQCSQVIMDSLHNTSLKKSTVNEMANINVLLNALRICAKLSLRGCPTPPALPRRIANVICKEQFAKQFMECSSQDAWSMLRSLAAIGIAPPAALHLLDRYFDIKGRVSQLSRVRMVHMVEALCMLRSRGPALDAVCEELSTQVVRISPQQRLSIIRSFASINATPNLLYLFLHSGRRWRLKLSSSDQAELLGLFAGLRLRPRGNSFFKDLILTVLRKAHDANNPLELCYHLFLLDMFDERTFTRLEGSLGSCIEDRISLLKACRALASLGYFCYGKPATYDRLLAQVARYESDLYQDRQCLIHLKSLEIAFRIGHCAFPVSSLSPSAQQTLLRVRHAEVADLSRDASPSPWTQDIRRISGQVCNRTYFNITVGPFLVDFVRTSDGTPQTKLDKDGDERLQAVRQCVALEPLKSQYFYRGGWDTNDGGEYSELTAMSKYRHILLRGLGIEICPVSKDEWMNMSSDGEKAHYIREIVSDGMTRLKIRRKEHAKKISQIKWQKRIEARSVS
ncbi:hypothetical protein FOL47_000509 [Perkinsus chesapeaki]|uniref:RAP domain-containing protein n=1 Tax=Perkinsus chesapeaki TaxID=330153 RepID=A0A7J6MMK3_PERCH|nr:hypothetical protein FOL47_000509 [Perkinsus chesapeaki]